MDFISGSMGLLANEIKAQPAELQKSSLASGFHTFSSASPLRHALVEGNSSASIRMSAQASALNRMVLVLWRRKTAPIKRQHFVHFSQSTVRSAAHPPLADGVLPLPNLQITSSSPYGVE